MTENKVIYFFLILKLVENDGGGMIEINRKLKY